MVSQYLQPTGVRAYPGSGYDSILQEVEGNKHIAIFNMAAFNNSGGSQSVGLLRKFDSSRMKLYALEAGVYVLRPTPTVAEPQQLLTTVNNDGFAVGYKYPSGLIGVDVVAGFGATVVLEYFNGTAFVPVPPGTIIDSDNYGAAGRNFQIFSQPLDWQTGGPDGSGLDPNLFFLQVVATTAPGTEVEAQELWGGQLLTYFKITSDGSFAQVSYDWDKPLNLDGGENMMAYYSAPDDANSVSGFYGIFG